jgi:hypothetical protein
MRFPRSQTTFLCGVEAHTTIPTLPRYAAAGSG